MSNQRPATRAEFTKKTANDIEASSFGEDGVCDACKYSEYKKTIDWNEREKQLRDLCDKFRRKDGRYDVIVPGSGGKDSIFVAHLLKTKYDMNPLTVTWAPHAYTDIGWKNFQAWLRVGFDNVLFTPDPKVHAALTRLAFINLVNPFQPFILGQKITPVRAALMYDVPFIMYGENQAESHNSLKNIQTSLMDPEHFSAQSAESPLYFGGVETQDLSTYGITRKNLQPYFPPLRETVTKAGIEFHFMSHFVHWSPQQNYYYVKEISDFEPNPEGRSEGTYTKYASLDDKIDGQHYFTMLVKFGQGRAMNDAIRDIRDGYITREEGVNLVRLYDEEFPQNHFSFFLNYIGISEDQYWEIIDNARSPHLWMKTNEGWKLRYPCQ